MSCCCCKIPDKSNIQEGLASDHTSKVLEHHGNGVSAGGHTVSSGKKQGVMTASAQLASPFLFVCLFVQSRNIAHGMVMLTVK